MKASVAQWKSIALLRRGSRVRTPSDVRTFLSHPFFAAVRSLLGFQKRAPLPSPHNSTLRYTTLHSGTRSYFTMSHFCAVCACFQETDYDQSSGKSSPPDRVGLVQTLIQIHLSVLWFFAIFPPSSLASFPPVHTHARTHRKCVLYGMRSCTGGEYHCE